MKIKMPIALLFVALLSSFVLLRGAGRFSFTIGIGNRLVDPNQDFTVLVHIKDLSSLPGTTGQNILNKMTLTFPGFAQEKAPQLSSAGDITLRGHISKPGMFPFEVSFRLDGRTYSLKDYVVVVSDKSPGAFPHIGYYVFLARGDYWRETHTLAQWSLSDWEAFVDWMALKKVDTLYVLLNGYTLAYPSTLHPELRDKFSVNAKDNFLKVLIDYAHAKQIRVYLTLTTDDHAEGFGEEHPETARVDMYGRRAQLRALCLEEPLVQKYVTDMFQEALRLYPNADGVVVHPTEVSPDRFNPVTQVLYHQETGGDLLLASQAERFRWYNQQYAKFVVKLYNLVQTTHPGMDFVMFNCWWQDKYAEIYKNTLPPQVKVCVWYYGWQDRAFHQWPIWTWIQNLGVHRILYMPMGASENYPMAPQLRVDRHIGLDRMVSTAEALGVKSCVFFAGWDLSSHEDRMRDLMIARFPTISHLPDRQEMRSDLPELYTNYFGFRDKLLH